MIKILRTLKAPELRLLLAICSFVIFFSVAQTTPTGTGACGGNHEHGKVSVVNQTAFDIRIDFSGPVNFSLFVESRYTESSGDTRTGTYKYTALVVQGEESWQGTVKVVKDKTATVTLQ